MKGKKLTTYKRSILSAVVGVALCTQFETTIFAEPSQQFAMVNKDIQIRHQSTRYDSPTIEWGWWVKNDWQKFINKKLSDSNLKMLKQAARYGHAQAQYVLGMLYSNEDKIEKATFWLGKAADQGHTNAQFTYEYYINGAGDFGIGC